MVEKKLHIAMYPWLAIGHISPYLQMANKLADRGHKISFLMPEKTISKFESMNHHPDLITLIPITIPHVNGLPLGSETTADVPSHSVPLLFIAMDLTLPLIQSHISDLHPDFVFFDFCHWLPSISSHLGIKSVYYFIVSAASVAYVQGKPSNKALTEADFMNPPVDFPPTSIKLRAYEARRLVSLCKLNTGSGISFRERIELALSGCDAICFKTCREIEGSFCDYMEKQLFSKPVILSGPVVPDQTPIDSVLEEKIAKMLDGFEAESVVYCALGSEWILNKNEFEELVLGLELTGLPFLAALKPPIGAETVDSALPEGFKERTEGKGYVTGNWVDQQLILKHPSVGCFLTHCGFGSLLEGMVSKCQLVFLPNIVDQVIGARLMGGDFKVGVEVEKSEQEEEEEEEEVGFFTRYSVCKAVKAVMDDDNEVGKEVRLNHTKWREFLLSPGLENSYIDDFVHRLNQLRH